jgi:hypothetical protein
VKLGGSVTVAGLAIIADSIESPAGSHPNVNRFSF